MIGFDPASLTEKIEKLEKEALAPGFWEDHKKAKSVSQELDKKKSLLEEYNKLSNRLDELEVLYELVEEEGDESELSSVEKELHQLADDLDDFETKVFLSGEYDKNDCYMMINSGAGGTDAQDWAQMLFRMYSKWLESKKLQFRMIEASPGEVAGIKSATLEVNGDYAFGYLKGESGVHRLVRISPFDSAGRRHTSFASVNVIPKVEEQVEIELDENDLRIDTYRASSAGGQHVNVTDSAVRITHDPTGITVQCQNERSQHQNKETALKILKSRLYELQKEQKKEEIEELRGDLKEIEWGSQIRSYVLHPYELVKDHRINIETGNVEAVLDGELDEFIEGYLKSGDNI